MKPWEVILIAGVVSYALRASPLLVFRRITMRDNSDIARFFVYAAYAVMGALIYQAMYGEKFLHDLLGHFALGELLKLAITVLGFIIAVRIKNMLVVLAITLPIYAFVSWWT